MTIATLHRPSDPVDRGLALLNAGRATEASKILGRVARNNRLDGDAQHAYGLALHAEWKFGDALDQFQRADRLLPGRWQVLQNVSAAQHGLHDYEAAYATALRSLELNPENTAVLRHLADLHLIWGEMPEAYAYYEWAIRIDPLLVDDWVGKMFAHDLLPGVTGEQALSERLRFAATFEAPLTRYRRPHRQTADPDRRLRIGYLSGDFRDHTAAYMFAGPYEFHDREQFQIFSYSASPLEDSVGTWFRGKSNGWRAFHNLPMATIARMIYDDQIDVLVDTAGYTAGGFLPVFCAKPAPVQIQAWGYLTGSGLDAMDAILVDDILVPTEHQHHFSERCVRVPYALGYAPPKDIPPITARPSDRPLTFGHLGRSDKINPEAVSLWSDTLHAHPGSRMVLKDRGLSQARTVERVIRQFGARGIGPERLDIRGSTSRGEHLDTYNAVDVILDSVPQGGGTTTIEALVMGTPVLTMLGPRIISRIAGTTLTAIGKTEWIADDRDDFIRRAGTLAGAGGDELRGIVAASVVCDGEARTRAFEDAIRGLWASWCQKQTQHKES